MHKNIFHSVFSLALLCVLVFSPMAFVHAQEDSCDGFWDCLMEFFFGDNDQNDEITSDQEEGTIGLTESVREQIEEEADKNRINDKSACPGECVTVTGVDKNGGYTLEDVVYSFETDRYYKISPRGEEGEGEGNEIGDPEDSNLPDLVVTSFSMPSGNPGELMNASVTVRNNGSTSSGGNYKIGIARNASSMGCSTIEDGTANGSNIGAGQSKAFNISVALPNSAGNYTAVAMADSDCSISESNENNNTASASYAVEGMPTVELQCNGTNGPCVIPYNTSATLSGVCAGGATACVLSPGGGLLPRSTGNLTANRTYTLTASGPNGTAIDSVMIEVGPAPIADIKCNGSDACTVAWNGSGTISWTSNPPSVTSCSVSPSGWTGTSGSQSTGSLSSSRTYQVTCQAPGGSVSDSVTVFVSQPPQCSDGLDNDGDGRADYPTDGGCSSGNDNMEFTIPSSCSFGVGTTLVQTGGTTSVTWSCSNVNSCTVTGTNGDSWSAISATKTTGAINSDTTYTLKCKDLEGVTSQQGSPILIHQNPSFEEF